MCERKRLRCYERVIWIEPPCILAARPEKVFNVGLYKRLLRRLFASSHKHRC
jgi:hypothetical protein